LSTAPVVSLRKIRKAFGPTKAVDGVDLDIFAGEVHCLVGENGAGKSTLMRILAGFYPDYEGAIEVSGRPVRITSPGQAQGIGIGLVHQELTLVPELSVAENIFLGMEPQAAIPGFISRRKIREMSQNFLDRIGVNIDPGKKTSRLSVAYRQIVEIAKGLSLNPRVFILDEPSSSLTTREIKELFKVIRSLVDRGTAIIYISHKLEEVFEIAHRVTVMRDGRKVASEPVDMWNKSDLVKAMVGRALSSFFPHDHAPHSEIIALELRGLSKRGAFHDISLNLRRGEVVGIYGLIGAGRTELAEALLGLNPAEQGETLIYGRRVNIRSPGKAVAEGIALVPEDRRLRGLVIMHGVDKNISLPMLRYLSALGFVKRDQEREEVKNIIKALGIQTSSMSAPVATLSGGNQQKVVIGKWLMRPPRILILDEPTRGIDVGAKAEVHALIDRLAAEGMAIILISSELPEILGMSDRILVMREGKIEGEFGRDDANAENLGAAAAGAVVMEEC
jgi:ABC-type sugar transport system ATPase subunit